MELQRAKVLQFDLLKSYVRLPDAQQKRVVEFAHSPMVIVDGNLLENVESAHEAVVQKPFWRRLRSRPKNALD